MVKTPLIGIMGDGHLFNPKTTLAEVLKNDELIKKMREQRKQKTLKDFI